MRVLVLGGAGMLGHKVYQALRGEHEVYVTLRQPFERYAKLGLFDAARTMPMCDVRDPDALAASFAWARPHVAVNAVGIVKQLKQAEDSVPSILVNALLPHRLAVLAGACGARLIHISTDCVFSGDRGSYRESDIPDARDLYGRSKLLGEPTDGSALTLRTSVVGREIETGHGLLEWFLANRGGHIRGYTGAIFTGFPTVIFADILARIIREFPALTGLYHVASQPITKYQLLGLFNNAYETATRIDAETSFRCDRSMAADRFRTDTAYTAPPWPQMVAAMRADPTPYEAWRRT